VESGGFDLGLEAGQSLATGGVQAPEQAGRTEDAGVAEHPRAVQTQPGDPEEEGVAPGQFVQADHRTGAGTGQRAERDGSA